MLWEWLPTPFTSQFNGPPLGAVATNTNTYQGEE
jgi:hypothetical protein